MTRKEESVEETMARLAASTESVVPQEAFVLQVMERLEGLGGKRIELAGGRRPGLVLVSNQDDWSSHVLRWARVGMTIATVAAAAGVALAWNSSALADQEEALAYGVAEAFE